MSVFESSYLPLQCCPWVSRWVTKQNTVVMVKCSFFIIGLHHKKICTSTRSCSYDTFTLTQKPQHENHLPLWFWSSHSSKTALTFLSMDRRALRVSCGPWHWATAVVPLGLVGASSTSLVLLLALLQLDWYQFKALGFPELILWSGGGMSHMKFPIRALHWH